MKLLYFIAGGCIISIFVAFGLYLIGPVAAAIFMKIVYGVCLLILGLRFIDYLSKR